MRKLGGERVEAKSDDKASNLAPQQPDGKPPEGGTPAAEGGTPATEVQGSAEVEMLVLSDGTLYPAPVLISVKEMMARREAEAAKRDMANSVRTDVPVATAVTAGESVAKYAAADAKNSKSLENRGKNEHVLNGRLPRDKYARAQERKRRAKQRPEGVVASGRR